MQILPPAVYLLCLATSLSCAALLADSYKRNRARLLLWSALCFVGLAVNNFLLFVDAVIIPDVDLMVLRYLSSLAAITVLLYGLIWEAE